MKTTTAAYKQIIASGDTRNWLVNINLTLADNTPLTLTESNIMQGSFKILSASSSDSSLDIGAAIIGKCQFTLDNFNDTYTEYDFFNATAVVWVKLVGDSEYHRMGFYTVDEPTFAGSLVQLELLDNMWKFDREMPNISYPVTILSALQTVCTTCGVTLASSTFHGYNFTLTVKPEKEMNCREFLQYCAMIGCNFCVIDDQGKLDIRWYNTSAYGTESILDGGTFNTSSTPYSDGDSADGGDFTTYTGGDSYDGGTFAGQAETAYFTRLMSRNIGTDDITVTGAKFTIDNTDYLIGTTGYVLTLENPLVDATNVNAVLNLIWDVLQGFKFRTFNVTALPDIAPEVGDCVAVSYKGNMVFSYLTNYTFTPSLLTASLGAVTPTRSLQTRYSKSVQTAVELAREETIERLTTYDLAVQAMNELAINAIGAYQDYEELSTGGRVYYLSSAPITKDSSGHIVLTNGSVVFKTTGDGFFVSQSGGTDPSQRTWVNGYNMQTGELIINILYTIGIHADWINTGELTVGGSNVNPSNPTILVKDENDYPICYINKDGITMYKGVIQSANYDHTTGHVFSNSGMIIDLNNEYLRSTAFYLDDNGGQIGAAVFDDTSLKVVGDIELYSGSGEFIFKPADYYFVNNFKLLFKTSSGTSTVTLVLHQNGSDTTIGTYTATTDGVNSDFINKSIGGNNYYKITVTASTQIIADDVYRGYLSIEGFKGILQGIFKGYIESKSGKIAGLIYEDNCTFETSGFDVRFRNNDRIISIDTDPTGNDPPTIEREFESGGTTYYHEVVWSNDERIAEMTGATSQAAGTRGIVPAPPLGDQEKFLKGDGMWAYPAMFSDTDLTAGTSPLATGRIYLVYE